MQKRPKNCDDWWPTTLYGGNASPLGLQHAAKRAKARKRVK